MIAFGPVPSRRLGSSLGINHIPPKHCPYSCVYCQVGRTHPLETRRQVFFSVDEIYKAAEEKIAEADTARQAIDYITLVPDGEPTLDLNLGEEIRALRRLGRPVAVISNAALINLEEVRQEIAQADWVSLKVDSVTESIWRKINRPHGSLNLDAILQGILSFSRQYTGELVTETMFVQGVNDSETEVDAIARFLCKVQPFKAYLAIPTRPPAEDWVQAPSLSRLRDIFKQMARRIPVTELLIDQDIDQFISTGDLREDILAITAVHPLFETGLRNMIIEANGSWSIVERLIQENRLERLQYRDQVYYRQTFKDQRQSHPSDLKE